MPRLGPFDGVTLPDRSQALSDLEKALSDLGNRLKCPQLPGDSFQVSISGRKLDRFVTVLSTSLQDSHRLMPDGTIKKTAVHKVDISETRKK
mmetsp:Transcript_56294/g.117644  ORF Transcript_56294/g.117644 Transcript_56294/m.117644 type:complete len:92 (+) Transcript_56294:785-1060(+)